MQWRALAPKMQSLGKVFLFDFANHGKSAPYKSAINSIETIKQDAAYLFNRFKGQRNIIIAHSMGAVSAVCTAINHKACDAIVLIAPLPAKAMASNFLIRYLPIPFLTLTRRIIEKIYRRLSYAKNTDPDLIAFETECGRELNQTKTIKELVISLSHMQTMDIQCIDRPVLMFVSDEDGLVPKKDSLAFYGSMIHLKTIRVQACGHLIMLEYPDDVFNGIVAWYRDVFDHTGQAE